jgi:hypothetical protein
LFAANNHALLTWVHTVAEEVTVPVKVRYKNGIVVRIKKGVMIKMFGHPVQIIDRKELHRCLRYQALQRNLKGKRRHLSGYTREELSAMSA